MDVNLPRDKETGKTKGFGFLMYEDQRSTVLAVDNLNGANVLERALRVDHVKGYKQSRTKDANGEWVDAEQQSMNARPEMLLDDGGEESSASSAPDIDPEDPMYDFLLQQWREQRQSKKSRPSKSKGKHKHETPEERRARKERKRERKAAKRSTGKSEGLKGVEALLKSLGRVDRAADDRDGHRSTGRSKSPRGPPDQHELGRHPRSPKRKHSQSPIRSSSRATGRQ